MYPPYFLVGGVEEGLVAEVARAAQPPALLRQLRAEVEPGHHRSLYSVYYIYHQEDNIVSGLNN